MKAEPRDYQIDAVQRVSLAVEGGCRRILATSSTGTGKTNISAWIAQDLEDWYEKSPVLFIAHRDELINEPFERFAKVLDIDPFDMGIEKGTSHAPRTARYVFASVQTLLTGNRLDWFFPKLIIADEAHHYSSEWRKVLERFLDKTPDSVLVGMTATPVRTDKRQLYAYDIDGQPMLESKHHDALDKCLFQKLVFKFPIDVAIENGWLVEMEGHAYETGIDISGVKRTGGDFAVKALSEKVNAVERTGKAVEEWQKVAGNLSTMVFCVDVQHSYDAAQAWRDAGYTAEAADGYTETDERRAIVSRFKTGVTQVLCSCGIFAEGFDVPSVGCVVLLRPTASRTVFEQQLGRGLRPLPGIVDGLDTVEERIAAIARSHKKTLVVIDMVDIAGKFPLFSVAALMGLPPELDLQGHGLLETKRLLADFKDKMDRVHGEHPVTFEQLEGCLRRIDLLDKSGAKDVSQWRVTANGDYLLSGLRPGREARLVRDKTTLEWHLRITGDGVNIRKRAGGNVEASTILNASAKHVARVFPYEPPKPKVKSSALTMLTEKQLNILRERGGYSNEEISAMTSGYGKILVGKVLGGQRAQPVAGFEEAPHPALSG